MASDSAAPAAKRARTNGAANILFGGTISQELRTNVTQWVEWDRDVEARQWVIDRAAAGDLNALQQAFGSPPRLGTL